MTPVKTMSMPHAPPPPPPPHTHTHTCPLPIPSGLRRLNMEVEKLRNRRLAAAGQAISVQQEFEKR